MASSSHFVCCLSRRYSSACALTRATTLIRTGSIASGLASILSYRIPAHLDFRGGWTLSAPEAQPRRHFKINARKIHPA